MTTPKNEELSQQSQLVRAVEASLKIAAPETAEIRFRSSLLNRAASDLTTLKPNFVVRLYEAACEVKYPSEEVTRFRLEIAKRLGREFDLSKYREASNPAA